MWENVYTTTSDIMERYAVEGGWIYRNRYVIESSSQSPADWVWEFSITFVPEPAAP